MQEGRSMRSIIRAGVVLALIAISQISESANPDDGAWLIHDKVSQDFFILRVEMKTSKVGYATIAGGNRFAGRRNTGQASRFGVNLLGGGFSVTKDGAEPFMMAGFNNNRDEIFGEFVDAQGNSIGDFTGTLLGYTTFQSDLFQICKNEGDEAYRCINRGRDERCDMADPRDGSTFLDEEECREALYPSGRSTDKTAPTTGADTEPEPKDNNATSDPDRFENSKFMELFGISLLQQVEELEGWNCKQSQRSWFIKTFQCDDRTEPPNSFLGFTPFKVSLWTNSFGVCAVSGILYLPQAVSDIYQFHTRVAAPLLFKLGVPSMPTMRALNPKHSDYPVFGNVPLDKIGMERGGRIFRWENIGPERSILQLEAYEVDPENRILSEGSALNTLFTQSGIPSDSQINVAVMTLFASWWDKCGIQ